MVFEITRLWLWTLPYSRKNKYKSRYFIKKRLGEHSRQQQGCTNTKRGTIDKKNNSKGYNVAKKQDKRRSQPIGRNTTE